MYCPKIATAQNGCAEIIIDEALTTQPQTGGNPKGQTQNVRSKPERVIPAHCIWLRGPKELLC
jgi:hypothetical protein